MTNNSYLCRAIKEYPDGWRNICADLKIKVKDEGDLSIFNYDITADFHNPIVQEARGIIIDTRKVEVVCWPFRKFGNYFEGYVDEIDWDSAVVQEKIDGSIIKLWYDCRQKRWRISTNSCISADEAHTAYGTSFLDLVQSADGWDSIARATALKELDESSTYIFEIVSPENQIVIKFSSTKLYHIGTRNNKTGMEYKCDIGVRHPIEYSIRSLDAVRRAAEQMNANMAYPQSEGFVVVDKYFRRIKVKSPEYVMFHHLLTNKGKLTAENVWDLVNSDDFSFEEFRSSVPSTTADAYVYYHDEIIRRIQQAVVSIGLARYYTGCLGWDRRQIAEAYNGKWYLPFMFKGLDQDKGAYDIVVDMHKRLCKSIPEFRPEEDYVVAPTSEVEEVSAGILKKYDSAFRVLADS